VRMAGICARLQELGSSGDLAKAPGLIDDLEAEFGRVWRALQAALS